MMKRYAQIVDGRVVELLDTNGDIATMFHHSLVWVEADATVKEGWSFDGESFSEPLPPPGPSVEELRAELASQIESWRDAQERAGVKFDFGGQEYDGGDKSRLRLQDAVASGIGASGQFFWTNEANEDVPMDSEALDGLYGAMMAARVQRGFQIHVRQRQMKEEIAALDVDALQAYQVGWPEPPAEPADPDQPA